VRLPKKAQPSVVNPTKSAAKMIESAHEQLMKKVDDKLAFEV
jgi:hypothetical protein